MHMTTNTTSHIRNATVAVTVAVSEDYTQARMAECGGEPDLQKWLFGAPLPDGFVSNGKAKVCLNVKGCGSEIIFDGCTASGPGTCAGKGSFANEQFDLLTDGTLRTRLSDSVPAHHGLGQCVYADPSGLLSLVPCTTHAYTHGIPSPTTPTTMTPTKKPSTFKWDNVSQQLTTPIDGKCLTAPTAGPPGPTPGGGGVLIIARPLQSGAIALLFLNNEAAGVAVTCDAACFAKFTAATRASTSPSSPGDVFSNADGVVFAKPAPPSVAAPWTCFDVYTKKPCATNLTQPTIAMTLGGNGTSAVLLLTPTHDISSAASCASSLDCSLNGDCTSGSCVCDPAWSGAACDVLAFDGPIDKGGRAVPGYYNETEASWGGLPVLGDDGKTWNLVHAQIANHCPVFGAWTTNSFIARSISTVPSDPTGPYVFAEPLIPAFAHNPTVRRLPDGSYAMFFIGGWATEEKTCDPPMSTEDDRRLRAEEGEGRGGGTGAGKRSAERQRGENNTGASCDPYSGWPKKTCGPNMPGPSNDTCGKAPLNPGCGIAIATAPALGGPWSAPTPFKLEDQWESNELYCSHTNPSVQVLPNGTLMMAFNGGFCDGGLETIGLAVR